MGVNVHLVRTVCTIDYYLTFRMSPWFLQKSISGGPIAEQAIHLLDAVRYVLGEPSATRAHAFGAKNMALDHSEYDAENALQMSYVLAESILGVHTNHCGHERFSFDLEVIGPHVRLEADTRNSRLKGYLNSKVVDEVITGPNSLGLDKTGAWLRAIESGDVSFIRSTYEGSLETLALVEAGMKSLSEGRVIEITEL